MAVLSYYHFLTLLATALPYLCISFTLTSWNGQVSYYPAVLQHKSRRRLFSSCTDEEDIHISIDEEQTRRSFLRHGTTISTALIAVGSSISNANARGLFRFPCKDSGLLNTYHFLRSGLSDLEVDDIWSTNPLFLTNREAALSELGAEQVKEACRYIKSSGVSSPTVVRYSLAAASIDSANIIGEELRVGRDMLVPEFNYMDPRAIGAWDFAALNATEEAVWAMDADEGGVSGRGGRPPPNEDGTPAETLADQVVRLTNLMSVVETLYSGDTVMFIFPDGTGPALLSCLIGGISLNRVHELQFQPGEIRCNVNYNSINALASQPPTKTYLDILQRGRAELKQLQDNPDLLRNIKDLKYEEEREKELQELESRRKEEAKAKELERQKKIKEGTLQTSNKNSLDAGSLGIAGSVVGGIAVLSGVFGGSEDTDEMIDGGSNTTESVNTTSIDVVDTGSSAITAITDSENKAVLVDDEPLEEESVLENIALNEGNSMTSAAAAETYEDDWLLAISEIAKDDDEETAN